MEKIISVIVPVYNVEDYLPKCLDSILNQTFVDFELILVDDGSTDVSGKICDEYAQLDERIKVIHQKNGGLSNARNSAVAIAKGKYYSFIDSDDWVDEHMLFEMYTQAVLNEADIVIAGHFIVNLDTSIKENIKVKAQRILNRIEATSLILEDKEIHSFAWDKLYRRELFEGIQYPENRVFEDTATTYKLFNRAIRLVQMDKAYYYYLRRESSICLTPEFSKVLKRKLDNYLAFQERYEFTLSNQEYAHMIDICQEKAFTQGQQLLHFIVKNKINKNDYHFTNIFNSLATMDLTNNQFLSMPIKIEHFVMKFSHKMYLIFLQLYYLLHK